MNEPDSPGTNSALRHFTYRRLGKGDGAYRYRRGRNPSPDVGGVRATTGRPCHRVRSYRGGTQAIINSQDEKFDLLITDIELGSHAEGGLTIGKMVQETRKGTPVLYTSGHPATDGMQKLFAEPSMFLPKPYTAHDLTDAVSALVDARL